MTRFLLTNVDTRIVHDVFNRFVGNSIPMQLEYPNIDQNLIADIEQNRDNPGLKVSCDFVDLILETAINHPDLLSAYEGKDRITFQVVNLNDLNDYYFDYLFTDEKGVLINLDSPEKNSYLLFSLRNLEILDRAQIDNFNGLSSDYKKEILKQLSKTLKIQLEIYAQEPGNENMFYVRQYSDGRVAKFLKHEYCSFFDKALLKNKSYITSAIPRKSTPPSQQQARSFNPPLSSHFDSLNDHFFDKFLTAENGVLVDLDSPEKNSYLLSSLRNSDIIGDDSFKKLSQETKSKILKYINEVVKRQLEVYDQSQDYRDIFYVRHYKDGRIVKFLKPEYSDLIEQAVKENKLFISEAFKNNITSPTVSKDKPSDRIVDENVDDISDQDFKNLLNLKEAILIDLDKPQNNQRLIALLRNKDIFGEQNLDKLNPDLKIAFLNSINKILKTSLEIYDQESVDSSLFYVRKYSDGSNAKFLKYEHFNLIDEIINKNKQLIAKSIKVNLQQSTSQSLHQQPMVLETKKILKSSQTYPRVLEIKQVSASSQTQPRVLPIVLETRPVKELIDRFNNPSNSQNTSSTPSAEESILPGSQRSISPRIASAKELFENPETYLQPQNKSDSSNSPRSVITGPRSFYEIASSTTDRSWKK